MFDPEHVSSLIGDIYDALVDQTLWIGALDKAAQFVGAQAGVLLWQNPASVSVDLIHASGIEPHYVDLYVERYAKLDPTTAPMFQLETDDVASPTDLLPHGEFANSIFYREWLEPQGFVDLLQASLDKSPTDFARLFFLRKSESGMVDGSMRERLRLIVPHIRRAVLVGQMVDRAAAEAATFGNALDGIGAGLFFVDAGGRIVHANTSGQDMLAQGVLARGSSGKLASYDTSAVQCLYEVLGTTESGDADEPRGGAVPLTARDGEHYVAHVLPLTAGSRRQAGTSSEAIAAIFVGGTVAGFQQAATRAEWSAYSLAAHSLAMQAQEQVRAASWDPRPNCTRPRPAISTIPTSSPACRRRACAARRRIPQSRRRNRFRAPATIAPAMLSASDGPRPWRAPRRTRTWDRRSAENDRRNHTRNGRHRSLLHPRNRHPGNSHPGAVGTA